MSINMQLAQDVAQETGVNVNICKAILETNNGDKRLAISSLQKWIKNKKPTTKKFTELMTHFDPKEGTMVIIKATSDNPDVFTYPNVLDYLDTLVASEAEQDPVHRQEVEKERLSLEKDLGHSIEHETFTMTKSGLGSLLTSYIHRSTIGSMVEIVVDNIDLLDHLKIKQFALDLAMHCVAFRPVCIHPADFPGNYKSKIICDIEKELHKSTKAIHLWEPVIEGKLGKTILNNSLMSQIFIKSADLKVSQAKESLEKDLKTGIKVNKMFIVE